MSDRSQAEPLLIQSKENPQFKLLRKLADQGTTAVQLGGDDL